MQKIRSVEIVQLIFKLEKITLNDKLIMHKKLYYASMRGKAQYRELNENQI